MWATLEMPQDPYAEAFQPCFWSFLTLDDFFWLHPTLYLIYLSLISWCRLEGNQEKQTKQHHTWSSAEFLKLPATLIKNSE